jgi:hypothetical protein
MTPREVRGLQALAKAHGGSLTINPHTGLAEAGFLRNLLPMIAGAALASTGLGAPAAAALIGGGTAVAKGDLKAGLMAGIGAYGGAGLAQGAFTAGATPGGDAVLAEGAGAGAQPLPPVTDATAVSNAPATANPVPQANVQGAQLGSFNESGQAASGFQPSQPAYTGTPDASTMTPPPQGATYTAPQTAGTPNYNTSGAMDSRAAYDPSFKPNTYSGPTEASLKPEATGADRMWQNFNAKPSYGIAAIAPGLVPESKPIDKPEEYDGPLNQYKFDPNKYRAARLDQPNPYYQARMYNYAGGGPVEQMSNANAIGQNTGYPMANLHQGAYAAPWQTPISQNVVQGSADVGVNPMTGEQNSFAGGGGISSLGSYSDGGRMLKGPGDGMSDSIPAQIGSKQPARLADGEFVVPADVVSHLGNGSTDAGARQLYSMMDRIRSQRTGKKKQAPKVNPTKAMPV